MRLPLWSANVGIALALLAISNNVFRSNVLSVVLASNAQLLSRQTAVVSGAFNCTGLEPASVSAVLTQSYGTMNVMGTGDLSAIKARGIYQSFSVPVAVVRPPNGTFKTGPASLIVDVNCGSDNQTVSSKIHLF